MTLLVLMSLVSIIRVMTLLFLNRYYIELVWQRLCRVEGDGIRRFDVFLLLVYGLYALENV